MKKEGGEQYQQKWCNTSMRVANVARKVTKINACFAYVNGFGGILQPKDKRRKRKGNRGPFMHLSEEPLRPPPRAHRVVNVDVVVFRVHRLFHERLVDGHVVNLQVTKNKTHGIKIVDDQLRARR